MSNTQSRIQEQIERVCKEATKKMMELSPIHPSISEELLKLSINSALRGAEIALENAIKEIDKEMNKKLRGSSQDYLDGYLHGLAKASLLLTPPKP